MLICVIRIYNLFFFTPIGSQFSITVEDEFTLLSIGKPEVQKRKDVKAAIHTYPKRSKKIVDVDHTSDALRGIER